MLLSRWVNRWKVVFKSVLDDKGSVMFYNTVVRPLSHTLFFHSLDLSSVITKLHPDPGRKNTNGKPQKEFTSVPGKW